MGRPASKILSHSRRLGVAAATLGLVLSAMPPAASMPRLMDLYNAHPRSLPQHRDQCVICHVNANGSGRLTPFGERYEQVGLDYTERLMAEYPNLFARTQASAAKPAGAAQPAGGPGEPAQPVAQAAPAAAPQPPATSTIPDPEWDPPRYYRAECTKCHGKYADGDPLQGVPAFATRKWIEERLPQTQALMGILMKGKDKMVGQEGKISEEQGRQLLDYVKSIAVQYGS